MNLKGDKIACLYTNLPLSEQSQREQEISRAPTVDAVRGLCRKAISQLGLASDQHREWHQFGQNLFPQSRLVRQLRGE